MSKVSNETRLLVKLVYERMVTRKRDWSRRADNPNANSSNPIWVQGYEYAWNEWGNTLDGIVIELESK